MEHSALGRVPLLLEFLPTAHRLYDGQFRAVFRAALATLWRIEGHPGLWSWAGSQATGETIQARYRSNKTWLEGTFVRETDLELILKQAL
jgi:hypothetical protein